MAFLYGSCAEGLSRDDFDVDIALLFTHEKSEAEVFDIINSVTLELTDLLKREINVLYIDLDLSKPILHYNAIIHGMPVFIKDFISYVDMKLKALHWMEGFSIFGTKWQAEIVRNGWRYLIMPEFKLLRPRFQNLKKATTQGKIKDKQ